MRGTCSRRLEQSRSSMLVESFPEDEELARTALSCLVPEDVKCENCRKVGQDVLK